MATDKDILLTADFDLLIENGDFVIGESTVQEVGLIIQASQGEYKNEPLIGANLVKYIRVGATPTDIKKTVSEQLKIDGKDYDEIKEMLKIQI